MRASGVNATIMNIIGKLEQKEKRAIGIARIGVSRISGFYCAKCLSMLTTYSAGG